jgi:hypothetical protein
MIHDVLADRCVFAYTAGNDDLRTYAVNAADEVIIAQRKYPSEQAERRFHVLAECMQHLLSNAVFCRIEGIDIHTSILIEHEK